MIIFSTIARLRPLIACVLSWCVLELLCTALHVVHLPDAQVADVILKPI